MATAQVQATARLHAIDANIPFGMKGAQLLAPLEVDRGLACGCRCPGCDAPLVAKHGFGHRQPHFAHYGVFPRVGCAETAIHLYAKQALVKATQLHLPEWTGAAEMPNPPRARDAYGLMQRGEKVDWPRCIVDVWGAEPERSRAGLRPDVVMQDADGELLVEVRVAHAVDHAKTQAVRRLDLRMVEIDLSKTNAEVLADPRVFERWVMKDAPRHWIWLPAAACKWTEALRHLENEIKLKEAPPSNVDPQKLAAPFAPTPLVANWNEFRARVTERELKSLDCEPEVVDRLVGTSVALPGPGIVKVLERLTRASRVYRVMLLDGSLRTVFLGSRVRFRRVCVGCRWEIANAPAATHRPID